MDYKGIKCPVCDKPFTENDDIALLWLVKNIGNHELIAVCERGVHRVTAYVYYPEQEHKHKNAYDKCKHKALHPIIYLASCGGFGLGWLRLLYFIFRFFHLKLPLDEFINTLYTISTHLGNKKSGISRFF